MSLTLYFHPLSSFSWKVLIALYENDTPFDRQIVDLADPASAGAFRKLWPIGKFPVLRDGTRDRTVPESSIIIEYLAQHYPGPVRLVSDDPDLARETRLRDRFFDLYINVSVQRIVFDRIRPDGKRDPFGVQQAREMMRTALDIVDRDMQARTWAMGDWFSMADCAAAPALFYANKLMPFAGTHRHAAAYLERLMKRPSFARTLREAEPYFGMFPEE
jgi:glutathione S-transferase